MRAFVMLFLVLTIFAGANVGAVESKDCGAWLTTLVDAAETRFHDVALLPNALGERTTAAVLVRLSLGTLELPFFSLNNLGLGEGPAGATILPRHTFLKGAGVYAVLAGDRDAVVARAEGLARMHGAANIGVRILDARGPGPMVPWTRGTASYLMEGLDATAIFDEIAGTDSRSAVVYDVDLYTGIFALPAAAFETIDSRVMNALGIEIKPTFDRLEFSQTAVAVHRGPLMLFSQSAYQRLEHLRTVTLSPLPELPADFSAELAMHLGPAEEPPAIAAAAPASVDASPETPTETPAVPTAADAEVTAEKTTSTAIVADDASAAETGLPRETPATMNETRGRWIEALGREPALRSILVEGRAWHDARMAAGQVDASASLGTWNTPHFAKNLFSALWAEFGEPGGTPVFEREFQFSASAALNALSGQSKRAANQIQQAWANLYDAWVARRSTIAAPVETPPDTPSRVSPTEESESVAESTVANPVPKPAPAPKGAVAPAPATPPVAPVTAMDEPSAPTPTPSPAPAPVTPALSRLDILKSVGRRRQLAPVEAPRNAAAEAPKGVASSPTPALVPPVLEDLDDPTMSIAVQNEMLEFFETVAGFKETLTFQTFTDVVILAAKVVASEISFENYKRLVAALTELKWDHRRAISLREAAARDLTLQDDLKHAWDAFRQYLNLKPSGAVVQSAAIADAVRAFDHLRMNIDQRKIPLPTPRSLLMSDLARVDAERLGLSAEYVEDLLSSWHGFKFISSDRGAPDWTVFFKAHDHSSLKSAGQAYTALLNGDTVISLRVDEDSMIVFLNLMKTAVPRPDHEVQVKFPVRDARNATIVFNSYKQAHFQFLRGLTPSEVIGILRRGRFVSAHRDRVQIMDPLTTFVYNLTLVQESRGRFTLKNLFQLPAPVASAMTRTRPGYWAKVPGS